MILLDYDVWLITRAEWGARDPTSITALDVDVDTNHWGGPGFGAPFPHDSCPAKVRAWQNFHMDDRGWTDIAYNAVACPHGFLFEGRGRGRRSAANGTTAGNSGSYATCYLGGEGDDFTEAGERAMKASGNWLTHPGSTRHGHRDWKSTECPGNTIYGWVTAGQPLEDTLSATEVDKIIAAVTAEANRVIKTVREKRRASYLAVDYTRLEELGEDLMWQVNPDTRTMRVVPQPGDTEEEQGMPGKVLLFDLTNDTDAPDWFKEPNPVCNGVWEHNGYPRGWPRLKEELEAVYVIEGWVPPGWGPEPGV